MWAENRLSLDNTTCTFKSIVLLAHTWPSMYDKVGDYFTILWRHSSIQDNGHPGTYSVTNETNNSPVNVAVKAFGSAPLLISVVRDPDDGGDFFRVEDID